MGNQTPSERRCKASDAQLSIAPWLQRRMMAASSPTAAAKRASLLLLLVCLFACTHRTILALTPDSTSAGDGLPPGAGQAGSTTPQQRQLLQFSSLDVEAVKNKARRAFNATGKERPWQDQRATLLVPPGSGRMLVLEAPGRAKFKISLSASPRSHLSSGGPPPFLPDPIFEWPTEAEQCQGNGLLAAAFRQDRVPDRISRVNSPLIHFVRRAPTSIEDQQLMSLLDAGCDPALLAQNKKNADAKRWRAGNSTYRLPLEMVSLLVAANSSSSGRAKETDKTLEGRKQLVGWPLPQATSIAPTPSTEDLGRKASATMCQRQYEELHSSPVFNITLPGLDGNPVRTECGSSDRSKLVVYVYNCFTDEDAHMLVDVSVDVLEQRDDICEASILWTVQVMCAAALWMMGIVAAACIIPVGVAGGIAKVKRLLDKRRRAQAKKNRAKSGRPPSLKKVSFAEPSPAVVGDDSSGDFAGCFRMYHDTLSTLNNPSGYSRLYTVTATTAAALLVAAMVWAPAISPGAVHDNAFGDILIIPRKGIDSLTRVFGGALIDNMWYYFKVMGLSALVGHTVKLALLSNLSPPGPLSKGVRVSPAVWWRQVVLSLLGLLLLGFVILAFAMSLFVLRNALEILPSHWYLPGVMLGNFVAAVGFYVHYTFRRRPPLTSEAAREAAKPVANSPMQLPRFWMRRRARSAHPSKKHHPPLPSACASTDPHSAAKDTAADTGQQQQPRGYGDGSDAGSEGGSREEPKPSLLQRLGGAAQRFISKVKEEVCEDDNFGYSSWVLTPVWLTVLMVVFWWLAGVSRTGVVVDCLQDPASCSGGIVPFTQSVSTIQLQAQDLLTSGKEVAQHANRTVVALDRSLEKLNATLSQAAASNSINLTALIKTVNAFDAVVDRSMLEAAKAQDTVAKIKQEAEDSLNTAEKAGRWLGYTTAVLVALFSLFNIVKTFKRVLLFQVYMKKNAYEQQEMVEGLSTRNSTSARMLARVMSSIRNSDGIEVQDSSKALELELSPFAAAADAAAGLRHRPTTLPRSVSNLTPARPSTAAAATALGQHLAAHPLPGAGFSGASVKSVGFALDPAHALDAALESGASRQGLTFKAVRENSICVSIAQDIQRLEVDMARFGIGASTALFGVMASVMWLQVRLIGLVLTFAFTLVFHPMVWKVTWDKGLWIPVVTITGIVLFNMLFIKRLIGSQLLSDGTNIKHRGSWMTYFLMFQFTYMVLGTLYAIWRVILAIVSIMLFAVAALDKSLMTVFTMLDGPYIAFVASVKLEGAYLAISQRDVEAEAAEARRKRLQQLQEEQEEEEGGDGRDKQDGSGDGGKGGEQQGASRNEGSDGNERQQQQQQQQQQKEVERKGWVEGQAECLQGRELSFAERGQPPPGSG